MEGVSLYEIRKETMIGDCLYPESTIRKTSVKRDPVLVCLFVCLFVIVVRKLISGVFNVVSKGGNINRM